MGYTLHFRLQVFLKLFYLLKLFLHKICKSANFVVPLHPHSVLGKQVRFLHRPAAVICNIVCFVSKSLPIRWEG